MKPFLLPLACLALALPIHAQETQVKTRLHGMQIKVEELGVPSASSDKVDLEGVQAIKVNNQDQEIASCQFHALPEETVMTATPAVSVNPNEEVVMRVPGKYSAGGPVALLECKPEGVPAR